MTFYICPPLDHVNFATLLTDVENRLNLLYMITHCNGDVSTIQKQLCTLPYACVADSYIENTCRDTNAHFILRLVSSSGSFPSMREMFVRGEHLLLLHRLQQQRSLHGPVTLLRRELARAAQCMVWAGPVLRLAVQVVEAVAAGMHCVAMEERCNRCVLKVPWQAAPSLVSSRRVVLQGGSCCVPCSSAAILLGEVFQQLLEAGLEAVAGAEGRMREHCPQLHVALNRSVSVFLRAHQLCPTESGRPPSLPASAIPRTASLFPPCMLQLQRLLQRTNRLQHHQRYRYTLFLKDIGVSLDQNILYWQQQYSLSPAQHSGCGHSWRCSAARYTYSIRHMYGLEGRRRQARAHDCAHLQKMSSQPSDCGGCPFATVEKNLPEETHANHLNISVNENIEKLHSNNIGRNKRKQRDLNCENITSKFMRYNSVTMTSSNADCISNSQSTLIDVDTRLSKNHQPSSPQNTPGMSCINSTSDYSSSDHQDFRHPTVQPFLSTNYSLTDGKPSRTDSKPSRTDSKLSPTDSNPSPTDGKPSPSQPVVPSSPVSHSSRNPDLEELLLSLPGMSSTAAEDIISAACAGKPSVACRMTLAWMTARRREASSGGTGARGITSFSSIGASSGSVSEIKVARCFPLSAGESHVQGVSDGAAEENSSKHKHSLHERNISQSILSTESIPKINFSVGNVSKPNENITRTLIVNSDQSNSDDRKTISDKESTIIGSDEKTVNNKMFDKSKILNADANYKSNMSEALFESPVSVCNNCNACDSHRCIRYKGYTTESSIVKSTSLPYCAKDKENAYDKLSFNKLSANKRIRKLITRTKSIHHAIDKSKIVVLKKSHSSAAAAVYEAESTVHSAQTTMIPDIRAMTSNKPTVLHSKPTVITNDPIVSANNPNVISKQGAVISNKGAVIANNSPVSLDNHISFVSQSTVSNAAQTADAEFNMSHSVLNHYAENTVQQQKNSKHVYEIVSKPSTKHSGCQTSNTISSNLPKEVIISNSVASGTSGTSVIRVERSTNDWFSKAMDPSSTCLSFVSPVQYYSLLSRATGADERL